MIKITHEEHNHEPSQAHPTHRQAGYSDGDKGISARFIKLVRRLELSCLNSSGSTDFALLPLGIYTISVCYLPELQGWSPGHMNLEEEDCQPAGWILGSMIDSTLLQTTVDIIFANSTLTEVSYFPYTIDPWSQRNFLSWGLCYSVRGGKMAVSL